MRPMVLALLILAASAPARADALRPSEAACDAAKIGARELADCLRAAQDKSDRDLSAEMESALKSIDAKPKMLTTRKARWKRFLNDSQTQWTSLRDSECQDLAPLEATSAVGDARLSCLIDLNVARTADLKSRYP